MLYNKRIIQPRSPSRLKKQNREYIFPRRFQELVGAKSTMLNPSRMIQEARNRAGV